MAKKRHGWKGGLAPVLMILKGACIKHGLGVGDMSPYKMANSLIHHLSLNPPPGEHKQDPVLWLCAWLKENGYKRAPYARSIKKTAKRAHGAPSVMDKKVFYESWEWRTLRMKVLKEHGTACQCCGANKGEATVGGGSVRIVVDHIKPLSKFWELRLSRDNLQVLCDECNMGKGAWDETDYRSPLHS